MKVLEQGGHGMVNLIERIVNGVEWVLRKI